MQVALQKYNLEVQCKKGTLMHIPHALSRVYLKTTDGVQTKFCEIHVLETVDHEEYIQIEPPKRDVFHERIAADGDIQELIRVIKLGWPDKKKCPPAVQPYYDKLRVDKVVGSSFTWKTAFTFPLRKDMPTQLHSSYIGIGGCVCCAREILY